MTAERRSHQPADEERPINHNANNKGNDSWDPQEKEEAKKKEGSSVEETERLKSLVRIIKFVISIIVFAAILITGVLSKLSLMFMVSHIVEDRNVSYCNINLPHEDLQATVPLEQRIAWIWAIIISYAVPELGALFRAWRFCYFKNVERSQYRDFMFVACAETLHVIGLALLLFYILPHMDVVQGVMLTNCLCFIPGLLNIFTDVEKNMSDVRTTVIILNVFAMCGQITGLIAWPLMFETITMWHIPVAIILISFHWWENFVSEKSRFVLVVKLYEIKKSIARTRYNTYLYVSVWKILMFIILAIFLSNINTIDFFIDLFDGLSNHTIPIEEVRIVLSDFQRFPELRNMTFDILHQPVFAESSAIYWTIFIQIVATYSCYILTKFACKIKIQTFSFSVAINLVVPVSVCILLMVCALREIDVCAYHNILPDYLFFVPPPVYNLSDYVLKEFAWVPILWLLSQIWISRHIWNPKSTKNASTDTLFITPLYNGLIIDQSLVLNRRRHSLQELIEIKTKQEIVDKAILPEDKIPQVYVCATMWREEKEEMVTFLNSILRLDEDQCARRLAREYFHVEYNDCAYYNLETHIFFDNAFEKDQNINEYVKVLITSIPEAAQEVYKTEIKLQPPKRYNTPYGGRLEWILPGNTKMIVHLKHAEKIRKKKRWSQVMYMYYLLSYRISQHPDMNEIRKSVRAKNTFILALDGDIDFQPDAVHLLINRMKVDEKLGAACGRIHPVGDGPLVWYQKFEYAIGHWLQKATEHVIGCVLCSPGCFSLFRGSALLTSVMRKYTKNSEAAIHYVQYDQGEDRWLCTLILKQSFRVEYSAAADAYTHSPSGFNEFYIQRRRWIPSTMANIIDLLGDSKEIVKKNDSISMPYIAYQMMLMVGTILGPGTIFLMMIGALVAVFSIDIWTAFLWNVIPILTFLVVCYKSTNDKYQLGTAFFLTAIYSLVMMAVLTGVVIQFMQDGLVSPSSVFFVIVASQIIIAGLLHPQELGCLICGIIYYITIPSMYMLLVIYSIFNMNNVNWGTRQGADEKKKQDGNKSKYNLSYLGGLPYVCCTLPKSSGEEEKLQKIMDELHEIKYKILHLEIQTTHDQSAPTPKHSICQVVPVLNEIDHCLVNVQDPIIPEVTNFDWETDPDVINGTTTELSSEETTFWDGLIEKYLLPIDEYNMKDKELKEKKLAELRDKCVFTFIMLNTLFVLVVFLLQLNKDYLHIKWPFGASNEIFFDADSFEVTIKREYLQVEPIGLLFVAFFGFILIIQFIAMLIHRFGTLSQILAETDLDLSCLTKIGRKNLMDQNQKGGFTINGSNAVKFAKKWQKPKEIDDSVCDLENLDEVQDQSNLEENFRRNNEFTSSIRSYKKDGLTPKPNENIESIAEENSADGDTICSNDTLDVAQKSINESMLIGFELVGETHNSSNLKRNLSRNNKLAFQNKGFVPDVNDTVENGHNIKVHESMLLGFELIGDTHNSSNKEKEKNLRHNTKFVPKLNENTESSASKNTLGEKVENTQNKNVNEPMLIGKELLIDEAVNQSNLKKNLSHNNDLSYENGGFEPDDNLNPKNTNESLTMHEDVLNKDDTSCTKNATFLAKGGLA